MSSRIGFGQTHAGSQNLARPLPPSAPERTLQASGQGQAIARPQGRPTLLLRAYTIYELGGEWREPAAEDKLCVPVPLVTLVNDSEYSKSTGAKPILSRGCIYLVSPGALRAPTPPRPPF